MGNIVSALLEQQTPQGTAGAEQLRLQARDAARLRGEEIERSKQCYAVGDHAGAKRHSQAAKGHAACMERLNARAADAYFEANNAAKGRPANEVDLHGLHVREAVSRADQEISAARARGDRSVVLIVGRGLHSSDGVARLKPELTRALMRKHSLRVTAGVPNEGCLLVELGVPSGRVGWFERLLGCLADGGGGGGGRGDGRGGGGGGGCVIC